MRHAWLYALGGGILGVTAGLDLLHLVWRGCPVVPIPVHGDVLLIGVALIIVGGLAKLNTKVFVPLRETFVHGYTKGVAAQAAADASGEGGKVVQLPSPAAMFTDIRPPLRAVGNGAGAAAAADATWPPTGRHHRITNPGIRR